MFQCEKLHLVWFNRKKEILFRFYKQKIFIIFRFELKNTSCSSSLQKLLRIQNCDAAILPEKQNFHWGQTDKSLDRQGWIHRYLEHQVQVNIIHQHRLRLTILQS